MACTFKDGVRFVRPDFASGKPAQGRISRNYQTTHFCHRAWRTLQQRRLKTLWLTVPILLLLIGGTARADAAYIGFQGEPVSHSVAGSWSWRADGYHGASLYLDEGWYYLLDKWQYDYLDRRQYDLMNGLNYVLGHPMYPKLFESVACGALSFESSGHVGFSGIHERVAIWDEGDESAVSTVVSEGNGAAFASYGPGDYIDRRWYLIIDRQQYYYLDRTQYLLNGGLAYLFGRFSADPLRGSSVFARGAFGADWCNSGSASSVPEPSTIAVLALGSLCLGRIRPRRSGPGL